MSKMLEASCVAGVVTAEGIPVPAAEILSQGVGASSGRLFIDENDAVYIPDATPDLKTTLDKVLSALDQVVTALNATAVALTAIDAAAAAKLVVTAPVATAAITQVTTAATAITAVEIELQTLKASLK